MPTLFRFVVFMGMFAAIIFVSAYVLSEYFEPEPKQITKSLRNVQIRE